jgi:general secretion pathway protein B
MSLILEALRKSEAERRRGDTPNVHTELPPTPLQRQARIPAWSWVLLAIVGMSLGWWMATDRTSPSPMAATQAAAASTNVNAAHPTTSALPPVTRLSPAPTPAAVAAAPAAAPITTPIDPEADRVAPAPPASSPHAPSPTTARIARGDNDGTMQLSELSAEERKALPPLKLSMHMWNDDPARRFIILDGNRLGEGDRTGDAVITAITPDGAVLDWNGHRIRLTMH